MGRIKIIKMRFDFDNEYDVATYHKLAESAQRADRRGRGNQAIYLASLMLGVRSSYLIRSAGLTEAPYFAPTHVERLEAAEARLKEIARDLVDRSSRENHVPVLRLVPPCGKSYPEKSA